ncbi:MAG: efflux RND transporter permease subunit [Deferrisomatales bacterium]
MFLPHFSIRRPVTATVMVGALVVFGAIGFSRLGISLYPDVDFPMVTVTTTWENARPEEVDGEVTDQLEDAISAVSGIKHIVSQSFLGRSQITVEFELSKDIDVAAQEVRDKVSARLGRIPREADAPVIDKLDINAQPIMWLALTGQQAIEELTRFAGDQVRPMLQRIDGVGEVRLGGAREKEVRLWLYRERLAAYNVGVEEVIAALRAQHVEVPGGTIDSPEKEFVIRTVGQFEGPEEFNELIVTYRQGTPVRLRHLGYAEAGRQESMSPARFTTREGPDKTVALGVSPRSGANQVAIAREVKRVLPQIEAMLLEGMAVRIASDNTRFIEESIAEIRFQLLLGGLAAALTILFFLQNLRTTLISAVAIPTSIVATFATMYWMGFTLNNMSMLALVTAVGLVIDDAIVMVENIFRHRDTLGKGPMRAAYDGSAEVFFAIIATTGALAGVFLPVAFMGGIVGRFFFEFAVTMAFAVLCSTFVAMTAVPMLSSRFLRLDSGKGRVFHVFDRAVDALSRRYRVLLGWALRHRLSVVAVALAALVAGGVVFQRLGKEFITAEDQSRFIVRMKTPLSYSLEKTDLVLQRVEDELRAIPEVSHFFSVSGWGGAQNALTVVTLVPKDQRRRTQKQIQAEINAMLRQVPDTRGIAVDISPLGGGARNEDIQLVVQGPDLEALDRYSQAIMDRLGQTPGYVGISRDLDIGKPEVRLRIDRERAADAGVSVRDVAAAVGALMGGVKVGDYKEGGKSYDVRLRLVKEHRELPEDVGRLWLRGSEGRLVDASGFVSTEVGVGPSVINRTDRQRAATVYANIQNKVLGAALPEVQEIADQILPEEYTTRFAGRAEAFKETGGYVAFAFLLAIAITYMVLAAQFESFVQPLSIMTGLPLAFVGAFGLLYLLGNTFNLFSMIALILLVGLVTKNGILLIEFTNQLRARGLPVYEALVEAGATRLRPILMTAVSTVAGVAPVALGLGVGSESRQPLAVAIAGGILSSTFLTLAVVPVAYSYLDQLSQWRLVARVKDRLLARDHPVGADEDPSSLTPLNREASP